MVKRRVSDQKVADPWFYSLTGYHRCIHGKDIYAYFPEGQRSLSVAVAQPDKRFANRNQKRWCDWTNGKCLVETGQAGLNEAFKFQRKPDSQQCQTLFKPIVVLGRYQTNLTIRKI